ncbi:MAG: Smr/MutS family protein [Solidesulfovibrio sp.]|uniref:Smr/MutS family protein n=1 Tax=Solidesulfovibrio sp. TaxID=2910990 RepID=UPI002B1EEBA7|nr:Smr/MutS family protein [Solidesulfovibrio sp.]MEA4855332.1 Smr/MutS family protein [Solidesulfovibrio sp.]
MSKKDPADANRPFADALKGLKVAKKKHVPDIVAKAVAKAEAPATPADTDETAFFRAMSGVDPMDREKTKGRDVHPAAPPPTPPTPADEEQKALAALQDLVSGKVEFTLEYSDEYVQGFVTDLDPKVYRQLRAGQFSPEAHFDLHGLNADQAQLSLLHFVREHYLAGKRCLLVIPGRGANSPGGIPVLKEELKSWLTRDPLKRVVLAFSTAQPRHGGAGALYVLLRKFKKTKGKVRFEKDWPDFG